jgi:stage II sporulation protein D
LPGAKPAKLKWHVIAATVHPGVNEVAAAQKAWRARGYEPQTFEVGSLFALKGRVLDSRRVLVTVAAFDDEAAARAKAKALGDELGIDATLYLEVKERPSGTLEATDGRVVVRNAGMLWFLADDPNRLTLADVPKEAGGRELRPYFGQLYAAVGRDGKLVIVNSVSEEKLLAGLLPAEMSAEYPSEALKAQAVAARNILLAKIAERHPGEPFSICSTQHCQVYAGAGHEDPRTTKIVQDTRGQLLVDEATQSLIDTLYSASCGGHGEDNDKVWGTAPDPSLRGKLDLEPSSAEPVQDVDRFLAVDPPTLPYCARPRLAASSYRWSALVDVTQLAARANVGRIRSVDVVSRGVSGRVAELHIVGEYGTRDVHGELAVRRMLGGLKSSLISLFAHRDASGFIDRLNVHGGGYGHGIGMCQVGAVGMAEAGKKYDEILRHYYTRAKLERFY